MSIQFSQPAVGQSLIVPDDTLGAEQSQVFQNFNGAPIEVIVGGAQRAQNLFHSFEEFNVDEGRSAFFFSPDDVNHIFSRVTGNNPSNILGTLGTFGSDADLFFMNPNGILFGPNSSLNVQGSFAAVTADAIQFGEQGFFSVSNPEVPSNLLTVNPSAFFFNPLPLGTISNGSSAPAGLNPSLAAAIGLRVPDGRSLVLLGGDVTLDGSQVPFEGSGSVNAFDGQVEIGGLSSSGIVNLRIEGDQLSLDFPENVERADIAISDGALVDTTGSGEGSIAVYGRNVDVLRSGVLLAGIGENLGEIDSQAGDIFIDATDSLTLSDSSFIGNAVLGTGNSGSVNIRADSVTITRGSGIVAASLGQGNAGNVSIQADDAIILSGRGIDNSISLITTSVASLDELDRTDNAARGTGGDIVLDARHVILMDGAQLATTTFFAEADAGNIRITATDTVLLNGDRTVIQSATDGLGNAGNIRILTRALEVQDQAALTASTSGEGNAGRITINASDRIAFANNSAASSTVVSGAIGNGNTIDINTSILELRDGSVLTASTSGEGNAGSVVINASDRIRLDNDSSIVSSVSNGAVGDGGDITITTSTLEATDGSQISANSLSRGDTGKITIRASDRIRLTGTSRNGESRSGVFSVVDIGAIGNGRNIRLNTPILEVLDEAVLTTSTAGQGNAGNITIHASDRVTFADRSAALSTVTAGAVGNSGNINITTTTLAMLEGAVLTASTSGQGDAGNINIIARERATFSGTSGNGRFISGISNIINSDAVGNGGDISIVTSELEVLDGAVLTTSTLGNGNAGGIVLNASDRAIFADTSNPESGAAGSFTTGAFSTVEAGAIGDGANLRIVTPRLDVLNRAALSTSTAGRGNAGNVMITASDRVTFAGNGAAFSAVTPTAIGRGGDIDIETVTFTVQDQAQLLSSTGGEGDAGNILINASDRITFSGESAALSTVNDTANGMGGRIDLTTDTLAIRDGAVFAASTLGNGNAGPVMIRVAGRITLTNGSIFSSVGETANGSGNNITIRAGNLSLGDRSRISAESDRILESETSNFLQLGDSHLIQGDAGNIFITVDDSLTLRDSDITTEAVAFAGGEITIRAGDIRLLGDSDIQTFVQSGVEGGGDITLT
ncbi:MAG: filamentous hemagglutinin N-terminal domain-containing protein, partial [Cyanobacteria bacterium J06633_2]